ncbi:MAG: response regulator [Alphaproteobacteria bacterium]|jgi:two-component system chemotaxis response regulator CheY|nr:response regulator [Alphaproteobacteria bacterium]MCB1551968.1 response regulator [Alphaproteobacteria bacterium]MCB9984673.1 response regulator [Micavibrio sp.]HPQ50364.1 response regulator [Alphaproteobacteria bacterium]HRK98005.1 response regulator [Alphaproteobacteria bacterium]
MTYKFDKVRILVVEDNVPMLEICKSLLLTFGVGEVLSAKNGEDGYQVFRKENPDMVIADWMMHPTDGISLTRRIRNDPSSPNPYAPIILMTGFSEKKRVVQARDAGVTEFLVKPFTAKDLYKRIAQIIERPRQFVRSEDFFGPDRRRKADTEFNGPLKRESDAGLAAKQKQRMQSASLHLDKLRDKAGLSKGDKINVTDIDFS